MKLKISRENGPKMATVNDPIIFILPKSSQLILSSFGYILIYQLHPSKCCKEHEKRYKMWDFSAAKQE